MQTLLWAWVFHLTLPLLDGKIAGDLLAWEDLNVKESLRSCRADGGRYSVNLL